MSTSLCEPAEAAVAVTTPLPSAQELWQRYHQRADISIENGICPWSPPFLAACP